MLEFRQMINFQRCSMQKKISNLSKYDLLGYDIQIFLPVVSSTTYVPVRLVNVVSVTLATTFHQTTSRDEQPEPVSERSEQSGRREQAAAICDQSRPKSLSGEMPPFEQPAKCSFFEKKVRKNNELSKMFSKASCV